MHISSLIQISSLLPRNVVISAVRSILLGLDSILYTFIGFIFSGIFSIANLDQIDAIAAIYDEIQQKVYVVLGIVMLFKVTITLLTYLVNPDMMTNKEQGANKLIVKIITSLVLLIVVPTIVFPMLSRIQLPLLNTVGKVITGNISNFDDNSSVLGAGQEAALSLIHTFFYVEDGCAGNSTPEDYEIQFITDITEKADAACINQDGSEDKNKYQYTYIYGVSSAIALISVVILIIIGINVAIRAFKLIVLKLIAPVPILSYITTKSGKESMLNNYIKLFTSTYLDLFVQFGVFYLVMTIFARLQELETILSIGVGFFSSGGIFTWPLVFIGLLIFALMAPKFIKKALNIKDSEFGTGIAGMLATGTLAANAVGSGVAAAAGRGGTTVQNIGAGIAGGIRGITAGAKAGFGSGKTDYSKVSKVMQEANVRMTADRTAGVTFSDKAANWFGTTFKGISPFEEKKKLVEGYDEYIKSWESLKSALKAEGTKGKYGAVKTGPVSNFQEFWGKSKDFAGAAEVAKSKGQATFNYDFTDDNGVVHKQTVQTKDAAWITGELEKAESAKMLDLLKADRNDPTLSATEVKHIIDAQDGNPNLGAQIEELAKVFERNTIGAIQDSQGVVIGSMGDNFKAIDDKVKIVQKASIDTKNSAEYMAAAAAAKRK